MDLATLALVAVFTRDLVAEPTPALVAALIRDLAAEPTPDLAEAVIPGLAAEVMTRGTVPLPTVADVSVLSYRPNDTALSWESETALCSRN